ncbi:unnamed protein product [Linum trigynum]|uniref:Uncharacterized protein n=1 Tax=Linum trigynum TaxID=586398 RepID=A0AAV2D1W1_9ROSI
MQSFFSIFSSSSPSVHLLLFLLHPNAIHILASPSLDWHTSISSSSPGTLLLFLESAATISLPPPSSSDSSDDGGSPDEKLPYAEPDRGVDTCCLSPPYSSPLCWRDSRSYALPSQQGKQRDNDSGTLLLSNLSLCRRKMKETMATKVHFGPCPKALPFPIAILLYASSLFFESFPSVSFCNKVLLPLVFHCLSFITT